MVLMSAFPIKLNTCYRKTPRKIWMTPGLVKSCETKSKLYKQSINSKTPESKKKFIIYRNKLKSLLQRAERDYYRKELDSCKNNA